MDEYNLPGLLETDVSPNYWRDFLSRLQLSGDISQYGDKSSHGVGGGGRVGYSFPIDNNNLIVGLLGSGFKGYANSPQGRIPINDYRLTGGDVAYQFGQNELGASYQKNVPNIGDLLNIYYSRSF